jgi:hypothetical protein
MPKRILRLVAALSLTTLGIGSVGCWEWHHPIDERREHRGEHQREHEEHEEHERESR